ncbi:MAG: carboxypeptidase-like regulatory domain-containing protein [Bacteroidota bacterium]
MTLAKALFIGIFISLTTILFSQTHTISGYIEDAASSEKLIGANIIDLNSGDGTITNTYGFFSLTLPASEVDLAITYIGYQSGSIKFDLQKDTLLDIALQASVAMDEVVITAAQVERIEQRSQMSTIEVPIAQIKKIPALLGEVDVLKALQLLPGVQSGGEGQSGLYVRGGSPDQNLILLDGVPVYNASHLFGFFSVFNADAIKDVKLIKGGFPARYGGRLSSVLEINMKEGNMQEFHGTASIGLVASKLTLEGPINKGKTSFIVSGRRTYIDILAQPFIKRELRNNNKEGGTGYYFYDLNAKINHKLSDKDRLYLSFYGGKDNFYFEERDLTGTIRDNIDNQFGWGNITSALRWNHVWTPKLFSNTTFTLSNYELDLGADYGSLDTETNELDNISLNYISGINDLAAKIDFDYLPNPQHFIRFGASGIYHTFKPGKFELSQVDEATNYRFSTTIGQDEISAVELAAYVEDDFEVTSQLKANVGLHFSSFLVDNKSYFSLQPRLSMRYLLPNDVSLKGSFSTMRQYIQLLAFEGIGLPTDLWLPTTERVRPQDSWQVALGAAKTINNDYEVSVEAYYKSMKNLIAYKDGEGLFDTNDWQDRITQGDGDSYGLEVFLQKKTGRLSGWLGYTLSWSNRQFDDLNFGQEFPYKYDRRHDLSIVTNYELKPSVSFSAAWIFGTGNAITLANSQYTGIYGSDESNARFFEGNYFDDRNNYRMRSYHRLDVGVNFVKQRKKYKRTWSIGAYNTYVRQNPFYLYRETEFTIDPSTGQQTVNTVLKQASLFPIIPYITYNIEF